MNRRPSGHGTIETLRSGHFRARVPLADGVRHTVGTFDSWDEADAMIVAFVERAEKEKLAPVGGLTLRALVRLWLDELEVGRSYAAMPNARSIARRWIETAPFADWPIRRITKQALEQWARSLVSGGLGHGYANQAATLVRGAFRFAEETGRVESNPAEKLRAPKGKAATEEPWTFLSPAEQAALLAVPSMPTFWRSAIAFAIGTGLRAGELLCLRLADLHADGPNPRVIVRYGSRRRAPKSRKIREVPLFGMALQAAREWLPLLATHAPRNPDRLAFPGPSGGFVKVSRVPDWQAWLFAAGIERRVRWHDLRHTTGASLVSGWWGRAWALIEVRDLLGHHSVKMTERYAHLGPTALRAAADGTDGGAALVSPRAVHAEAQALEIAPAGVIPRHPPRKYAKQLENSPAEKPVGSAWTAAESAAEELLRAAAAGADCSGLVRALAAAVLSAAPVTLAGAALAGGPHALDRALELAALVLDHSSRAAAFEAMGGDRC